MSNETKGWLLVIAAGCLEVLWPVLMKQSQRCGGAARIGWLALMMVTLCVSFGLLSWAVGRRFGLPIGTAYAVWTGLGAAGAAAVGILLFQEPRDAARLVFLGMVIAGIVGLKITHRSAEPDPAGPPPLAMEAPAHGDPGPGGS